MDEFLIIRGSKEAEMKFREELSKAILESYGQPPYDSQKVTDILLFSQDFYISKFEAICNSEHSYIFYREVLRLHEHASELRRSKSFEQLPEGLDKAYIAMYRRILKLIIEQGCYIDMHTNEKIDGNFTERFETTMNDLLFLGEMLLGCGESLAEQLMIEDATEITFDKNNLYQFSRRHHYEMIFQHIGWEKEQQIPQYIIDENGYEDFEQAILDSFGIEFGKVRQIIAEIMAHFNRQYGDPISLNRENLLNDIANLSNSSLQSIQKLFSGLTLNRQNKMPLSELVKKPHSLNRFLYRPVLSWKLDAKDCFVFGLASWFESYNSVVLNTIPWGNIPTEWEDIPAFVQYKKRKELEHDKWLDDRIEESIQNEKLVYQKQVKTLVTKSKSYPLDPSTSQGLGEIDFLIIVPDLKKIFIAECKHLVGRYDMINQRNDYLNFTKDNGKKLSFNTRLNYKVKWMESYKGIVEEHFRLRTKYPSLSLSDHTVEGIFFINTPTFYMYNSSFRIYTYDKAEEVLKGSYQDTKFSFWVQTEEGDAYYSVKYPYFRKPKMLYYDIEEESEDVDKYGYPINKP